MPLQFNIAVLYKRLVDTPFSVLLASDRPPLVGKLYGKRLYWQHYRPQVCHTVVNSLERGTAYFLLYNGRLLCLTDRQTLLPKWNRLPIRRPHPNGVLVVKAKYGVPTPFPKLVSFKQS